MSFLFLDLDELPKQCLDVTLASKREESRSLLFLDLDEF
jgi:hypothetical protein